MNFPKYPLFLIIFLASCSGYKNDGKDVYYYSWNEGTGGQKVRLEADPRTFKVLRHDSYAKDDHHVFYEGSEVTGADAATFETLGDWFGRDKKQGYYGEWPIISSHGTTFRVIDGYYSADETNVFYDTLPLNICSVKDFRFIYHEGYYDSWTTDGCYYYYMNSKVPSKDYANMTVYKGSGGFSKDRNYVYFLDHRLNYDLDGRKVVDTIDAASFMVTGYLQCHDKWGCFNPYHGRIDCKAN
jgi:hypothetical protein